MAIIKDAEITEGIEVADNAQELQIPNDLPVLPLRDIVIYPFMIVPLFVSREKSIRAVDEALGENRMILLASQRDLDKEEPTADDLYKVGTAAVIMRMLKLPDGRIRILVQGLARAEIESVDTTGPYIRARVHVMDEVLPPERSLEVEALVRNVRASMEKAINLGKNISPEVMAIIANLDDAGRLADLSASNLELKVEDAQSVLDIPDTTVRLRGVNELLNKEIEVLTVQQEINTQARADIDRSQREFYLRQQMKAIQSELGEGNELAEEVAQFREKIETGTMPKAAEEEALRQLKKLERMHPDAAETATVRNWMEIMTDLPWSKASVDNLDLQKAERILNEDHYGLEKVKDRIIEALAVRKLKEKPKGPILCLVGPPGVGKTSLGRSIARALDRKFMRLSLGGVHDEAEIRGHRRTYVGAMPGRVIQSIQQAGTNNPLIMLDEIDKVGADFRGDPSSALLEVLDPEQNNSFRDNYLGVTARDLNISRSALMAMIQRYTQEAGLRQLEREIGSICRKVARRIGEGHKGAVRVSINNLHEFLGAPKIIPEEVLKKDQVGVATGLAWTAVGGDVLFVEALRMKGKGNLVLTGQLGEVMRESAQAAYSYAKSRAKDLEINEEDFNNYDLHIHIPEGAIPKDGPSAGITLATAMVSALSARAVRKDVAMTGEITLRGNVLPVGGVKEKVLAARRARVSTIILPQQNRRDLDEVPKEPFKDIKFVFVDNMRQVFREALKEKVVPPVSSGPRPQRMPQAAAARPA